MGLHVVVRFNARGHIDTVIGTFKTEQDAYEWLRRQPVRHDRFAVVVPLKAPTKGVQ